MKFFEGCTALITGASSGLGVEFARQLAPLAHCLILVARREDRLNFIRNNLIATYPNLDVRIFKADLSQETDRLSLAQWLQSQSILVNFLINNAGLGDHGPFATSDWNRVRQILDVNITALTHLTHLLVPSMLQSGRAAILNVSSIAGFFPVPNMAVYAASKAYVTNFSEALRMELRPLGISVTALCPGPVPTEFFAVAQRPGSDFQESPFTTPEFLLTSAAEVVAEGLRAVANDRPRSIPNPFLWLLITLALALPICLLRILISCYINRKNR